ncbi:hypothetical protein CsatB_018462 [Cannabis sativa]
MVWGFRMVTTLSNSTLQKLPTKILAPGKVLAGVYLIFISKETVLYKILISEKRQVESLSRRSRRNLRLQSPKTTLKSICFGLEKELVAYQHMVIMDLPFQQSVLLKISHLLSVTIRRAELV